MRQRVGSAVAAFVAAAAMAGGLAAPAAAAGPAPEAEAVRSVPVAGMQVAIDPATGRLRQPTPAEARELLAGLTQMMKASPRAQAAQQHADGTLSMVLGTESLNVYVARLGADGGVTMACVDSLPSGRSFFAAPGATLEEK